MNTSIDKRIKNNFNKKSIELGTLESNTLMKRKAKKTLKYWLNVTSASTLL